MTKYTRRKINNAQVPTHGIDTGEVEEILDPEMRTPDDDDFIVPPPLEQLVDPTKVKQTFIPKQGEINKLVKQINTRILRGTHLPGDLKDLKAAYLSSPHFRDLYLFLTQNRMPLNKSSAKRLEINSRNYMILDGFAFQTV